MTKLSKIYWLAGPGLRSFTSKQLFLISLSNTTVFYFLRTIDFLKVEGSYILSVLFTGLLDFKVSCAFIFNLNDVKSTILVFLMIFTCLGFL